MTAPVTTAVFSPAPTPRPAPSSSASASDPNCANGANSANSDFSRILAEQRPDADAATDAGVEAGSDTAANANAAGAAAPNKSDDHDESGESADATEPADAPLAALALAIATQVAELQGAARSNTDAGIDGASHHAANNARRPAHVGTGSHDRSLAPSLARPRAAGAADASSRAASNTPATDALAHLSTRLSEDAAPRPGLRPAPQTSTPRTARSNTHPSDLPATARHAPAHLATTRDNAALFTPNATHTAASASLQSHDLLQTHQTPPTSATEPGTGFGIGSGTPALTAFDAPLLRHGDAAAPFSTTPPPALTAPLASPEWNRELGQRLVTLSRESGNTHSAELRLDPPELGPLRVTLTVTDGVAQAAFTSPHASVRHSIEAALDQLQTTLAEAGIELGQTSVSEQQHDQRHNQDDHPASALPSPFNPATASTTPSENTPAARSDGLVDAYV